MKSGPLGWELTTALVAVVVLAVAISLDFQNVVGAVLILLAVLTPIVLVSAGIRLVAGIIDENRRYRSNKALHRT